MAQPHKGARRLVQSRIPEPVYSEIRRRAAAAGTSASQYIADVMAVVTGHQEEVRDLDRADREGVLPLAI